MAVKGSATVTLSQYRDTESVTRYYKLQSSSLAAPDKPANVKPNEPPAGWSKSEPACDITKTLYTCDVTVFSDKTTHVSDVSKSTSYEAAKEAWNKAQTAQNTATEAAKTADNYISADSTGIMVSENKGATKETPSNATKNNVLITEKDVQIRNGQKVVASYGETIALGAEGEQRLEITKNGVVAKNEQNTLAKFTSNGMQIGDLSGDNMEIKDNKVSIRSGVKETLAIESAATSHSVTTTYVFHGSEADSAMTAGEIYTESHSLSNPVKINSVEITDESGMSKAYGGFYDVSIDGSQLVITIDASNSGANYTDWTEYTKCIVTYESGTVESTVKCNNIEGNDVYARNVYSERPDGTMLSVVDLIYPVGSIYMSVNSADPGTLFGGTWQQIKDRFLLSAGDTYAAGNTGGSAKATLPSHTHTFGSNGYDLWVAKRGKGSTEPGNQISGDAKYYAAAKGGSTSNYKWLESVDSKGESDVSHANMPPYLAVYVWKRIN